MRYDSTRQAGASESYGEVVEFPLRTQACGGVRDVERINPFKFYELGQNLAAREKPADAEDAFWFFNGLQSTVDKLVDHGQPVELGVSLQLGKALQLAVDGIVARHFTETGDDGVSKWKWPDPGQSPISDWEWRMVTQGLTNFQMIFAEEMREAATYRVPNRGIYNTRKLVDEAECTFPPDVEWHVPDGAKLEWRAAGRCLAFGMFTACGFHVARAVEVMLEAYFEAYNGSPDKKLKNWGHYLEALEKIVASGAKPMPGEKTLGELRQLKDDWRNPLMHPRVVLEEPDARAVFNNGETLVMMMAQELAQAAAGVQPAIPQLIAPEENAA